jgi:calcineurin-like phosphoesterase
MVFRSPSSIFKGRSHMQPIDCPFRKADQILEAIDPAVKVRFVDFHAELTSEKMAMGWHLNGRVSAVVGTHTHIPTADTRSFAGGTAYQTDAGMTGPYNSVHRCRQGHNPQAVLDGSRGRAWKRHGAAWSCMRSVVDVDEATGQARGIKRYTVAET